MKRIIRGHGREQLRNDRRGAQRCGGGEGETAPHAADRSMRKRQLPWSMRELAEVSLRVWTNWTASNSWAYEYDSLQIRFISNYRSKKIRDFTHETKFLLPISYFA